MDTDDRRRTWRYESFNLPRIKVLRPRVDVAEDWSYSLPLQSVRCCNVRQCGHNNLAFEIGGSGRDGQRARSAGGRYAMTDADHFSHTPLEFPNVRSIVGVPSAIQDVADSRHEAVAVAEVGASYVERLLKGGLSTEDCEIAYVFLCRSQLAQTSVPSALTTMYLSMLAVEWLTLRSGLSRVQVLFARVLIPSLKGVSDEEAGQGTGL